MAILRTINLYPDLSPYNTAKTNGVDGARSTVLEFQPDRGGFLGVRQFVQPIIKLFDSTGTELPGDTELFIGVKKAGESSARWAPGSFTYHDFLELSAADQAKGTNRDSQGSTLLKDLGVNVLAEDGDTILVDVKGTKNVDWSQGTPRFQIKADLGRMAS